MWKDDEIWYPAFLRREYFRLFLLFRGTETMLGHHIEQVGWIRSNTLTEDNPVLFTFANMRAPGGFYRSCAMYRPCWHLGWKVERWSWDGQRKFTDSPGRWDDSRPHSPSTSVRSSESAIDLIKTESWIDRLLQCKTTKYSSRYSEAPAAEHTTGALTAPAEKKAKAIYCTFE